MDPLETLRDLVRINSVNAFYEGGPGEAHCARYVADFWNRHGIEHWAQAVLPGRSNVIARLPGKDSSRRWILEAHMDTVSTQGMTIDPFDPRIEDGKLYGRGACDTKAGLAGMMCAMVRARREGSLPRCDVWMAAVVDEEHSCHGILRLVDGLQASAAIVAEPTELKAVVACKGVLRWRIRVRGRSAHSSKPHLGASAIHGMAKLIVQWEADRPTLSPMEHPLLGQATANIGTIQGGVQINFVPDACVIQIDRRLLPSESSERVYAAYQQWLDALAPKLPDVSLEMEPPMLVDPGLETDIDTPIVSHAMRILQQMRLDPQPVGVAFGSDASKLHQAGIPSIVFGPGSIDRAHTAVEYVEVEQVQTACEFYHSMLKEFDP
ncbi:MAG: M20 family metallopeptidase [Pirellula sp.]